MESLLDALMPFQKEGYEFGIRKQGKCLIADEMGLGKTLQGESAIIFQSNLSAGPTHYPPLVAVSCILAIAIAAHYQDEWPMLVVCPSSMKYTWASELEKWLPELEPGMSTHLQRFF
jgi:SWI/SNF-related matrix-associated actin-dependent regulator 1 of chromatin subfamily A